MNALGIVAALALTVGDGELQPPPEPQQSAEGLVLRLQGGPFFSTGISRPPPLEARTSASELDLGLNAALGYRFSRHFAAELAAGWRGGGDREYTNRLHSGNGDIYWTDFTLTTIPVTLGLRADFGLNAHSMYAAVGAGVSFGWAHEAYHLGHGDAGEPADERASAFAWYAGLGFEMQIDARTSFSVELRSFRTSMEFEGLNYSGNGTQLLAGFTFRFPAPAPRSEPRAPVGASDLGGLPAP